MNGPIEPTQKPEPKPEAPLFESFPQPAGWNPAWDVAALTSPARPARPARKPKQSRH